MPSSRSTKIDVAIADWRGKNPDIDRIGVMRKEVQVPMLANDRGTVMVEYAVLLSVVAVGCSLAVIALGAPLVRMFMAQEVWLMLSVP